MLAANAAAIQPDGEPFCLWPECVPIWQAWMGLQTQWRVGMGGATGLDYTAVLADLAMHFEDKAERHEAYLCIKACEREQLDCWQEYRAQQEAADKSKTPRPL